MTSDTEIRDKFWSALRDDRTIMLGLVDEHGHTRPMTAQLDEAIHGEASGPLYIFTSRDNAIVERLGSGSGKATATFASKGHDLFATIDGTLSVDTDRNKVDRLWNRFVAAWYQDGKDDPKLRLLRFDTTHAEIWVDASSMIAGMKMLIGIDPKQDYKDKVADVTL